MRQLFSTIRLGAPRSGWIMGGLAPCRYITPCREAGRDGQDRHKRSMAIWSALRLSTLMQHAERCNLHVATAMAQLACSAHLCCIDRHHQPPLPAERSRKPRIAASVLQQVPQAATCAVLWTARGGHALVGSAWGASRGQQYS